MIVYQPQSDRNPFAAVPRGPNPAGELGRVSAGRGTSAWAVLARLRGVDRGHLCRAGRVHRDHGPERVAAGQGLGGVTQRAEEPELGTVVVVGAGVVVDVSLLQLLQRRDDLLRTVHQLEQL